MTQVATLFATPAVATSRRSPRQACPPRRSRAGRAVRALTRPDAPSTIVKIASGVSASLTAALVALPAFADEAAGARWISPFAGVVDITVLGVVGLLAGRATKRRRLPRLPAAPRVRKTMRCATARTASAREYERVTRSVACVQALPPPPSLLTSPCKGDALTGCKHRIIVFTLVQVVKVVKFRPPCRLVRKRGLVSSSFNSHSLSPRVTALAVAHTCARATLDSSNRNHTSHSFQRESNLRFQNRRSSSRPSGSDLGDATWGPLLAEAPDVPHPASREAGAIGAVARCPATSVPFRGGRPQEARGGAQGGRDQVRRVSWWTSRTDPRRKRLPPRGQRPRRSTRGPGALLSANRSRSSCVPST